MGILWYSPLSRHSSIDVKRVLAVLVRFCLQGLAVAKKPGEVCVVVHLDLCKISRFKDFSKPHTLGMVVLRTD